MQRPRYVPTPLRELSWETEIPASGRSSEKAPHGRRQARKADPRRAISRRTYESQSSWLVKSDGVFLVILALSSALESPVTTPLQVKQGGRLVQTLFEILFAVLQRFHAPLQQEIVFAAGSLWLHLAPRLRSSPPPPARYPCHQRDCERPASSFLAASASCLRKTWLLRQVLFHIGVMGFDQLIELLGPALNLDPVAHATGRSITVR